LSATTRDAYSLNKLYTSTAELIHKSGAVRDAVTTSNVTVKKLMEASRLKYDGGTVIQPAIQYAHNQTIKFYRGLEKFETDPQEFMTGYVLPWAHLGGSISIKGTDMRANKGKEKRIDLMEREIKALIDGETELLNRVLWEVDNLQATTHPYTNDGGRELIGIPLWIQALGSTSGGGASTLDMDYDIGGIDQSANSWWMNQCVDAGGSLTSVSLKKTLSKAYNNCCQRAGGKPNFGVMDQNTHELIESSMQEQVRYASKDQATPGFPSMYYKEAELEWDGYVPDMETSGTNNGPLATGTALTKGSIFFINTDTFTLYMGKEADWSPRGFQDSYDQDGSTCLYMADMQLVCENRIKNGVIFDVPLTLS